MDKKMIKNGEQLIIRILQFSGLWRRFAGLVIPDVSTDRDAFIFLGQAVKEQPFVLNSFKLKIRPCSFFFETSG